MIAAGVAAMYAGAWESDAAEVEAVLKAALDAPQAVDCRGCDNSQLDYYDTVEPTESCKDCTNGDKYQALAPVYLYRRT